MNSIAAFPRVASGAPSAAAKQINAVLARADARVRRAAADCLGRGKNRSDSDWSRKITVTMQGPRYLSLVASDDFYCAGAAHPNTSTVALVFDLETGKLIDWAKLLPGLVQSTGTGQAGDGSILGTVRSGRLAAFFRNGGKSSGRDPECGEALKDTELDFILWPDAKQDGLVVEAQLPHAIAACGAAIPIPVETLRTFGVNAGLLDAIGTARRQCCGDRAR